ncbi:MAG: REP-associated tyrosine transposase [Gammaproteobacteria bacterium]
MARPLRLEFAGALYHVTSRGDRRENIYEDDNDRAGFLSVLGEICSQYNWVCHAYCLMSNHYHLLVETPEGNLSRGMRQLNGVYTQHFNRHHGRVGHVFHGRYKAILVDKNEYLLELARYIVLNPVRAGMVRAAREWRWSSYRATAGQTSGPQCLQSEWLLAAFGRRKGRAMEAYKRFVAQGRGQPSPWQSLRNQVYLGDERFVARMQRRIEKDKVLSEIPMTQRRPVAKPLAEYERRIGSRDAAITAAYTSGGYTLKEIGEYFGLHYSRVSRIMAKAKS